MSLSACNKWPPNEAEAREHFDEKRESFEQLADKMRATDYWRVSIQNGGNVRVTPNRDGDYEEGFVIDDDPEWHKLLADVGMFMVVRKSTDSIAANPGYLWGWNDNQLGESGYTNDPNMLDEYKLCHPEFKKAACGYCAVSLEDDWYLHYMWYPEYFDEEANDAYMSGDITLDERNASWAEDMRQCQIDGTKDLGYDVQELINSWDSSSGN